MAVYPVTDYVTCSRLSTGYGRDSSGTWQSYANNTLRYDYDDGVRRLLVEEARTNSIRNGAASDSAAGSPGTPPTQWTTSGTVDSLTQTIVGSGTENGVDYVDIQWNGTSSGTSGIVINFEQTTQIAASTGQTWSNSVFVKLASGSTANVSTWGLLVSERTAAGALVTNTASQSFTPTSTLTRVSQTVTLAGGGTTAFAQPRIAITYASGVAIDFTLRVGWPQLELGAFATSPIRTTSAATTRAADVVSMTLPTNLQSLSAYTLYAQWLDPGTSANRIVANIKGTPIERISFNVNTINLLDPQVVSAGSDTYNDGGALAVSAATHKAALAATSNDARGRLDGTYGNADAVVVFPSDITTLEIGHNTSTTFLNAGIQQVAVWGSRRTDSALATLTT